MKKTSILMFVFFLTGLGSCSIAANPPLSDADELSLKGARIMQKETATEIFEDRGLKIDLHMSIMAVRLIKAAATSIVADAAGRKFTALCDPKTLRIITQSGKKTVWLGSVRACYALWKREKSEPSMRETAANQW